ncbi:hypothetical protein [Quadrisphaera sp. INWT6]|uniref:hypothetical protein n=1 Tax=Quadrisphaera sp. INWT6 TaxID=2596917 RepID=UPI0019D5816F|nr:hypothetical protein [Quadrisphaera sp. INWT6]
MGDVVDGGGADGGAVGGDGGVPASHGLDEEWVRRRRAAAGAQADRLARAEAAEVERAREQVADFVERARAAGLPTEELRAVDAAGTRYRTGVTGWVLRRDGRAGVGEDGAFYLLAVLLSGTEKLGARLCGVRLQPSDPPLVWGRGGRDGDSIALQELLDRRLSGG